MQTEQIESVGRLSLKGVFTCRTPGAVCGTLECEPLPVPVPFHSLADMALEMDAICDYLNYPQAWKCRRHLDRSAYPEDKDRVYVLRRWKSKKRVLAGSSGEAALHFSVQIYCRQNVSIQGVLQIGKERIAFRSVLELLGLIDEALEQRGTVPQNTSVLPA